MAPTLYFRERIVRTIKAASKLRYARTFETTIAVDAMGPAERLVGAAGGSCSTRGSSFSREV
jgi:hypothetical protein